MGKARRNKKPQPKQQRLWAGEFLLVFLSADAFRACSRPFRQKVAGLSIDAAIAKAIKDFGGLVASATTLALSVELYLKALRMVMGLAPILVDRIYETIAEINKQGTTILLVEQNANYALDVSERGYVLETGEVSLSDSSTALRENPEVQRAYLGA